MHLVGRRIAGRYVVLGPLGEGGGGTVHRARDLVFERDVALKVAPLAETAKARGIHDELAALAAVAHPRIVRVLDVGHARLDGRPFAWLTTALVDAVPLDRFADGHEWSFVRRAVADVLLALAHLHRAGIRHGDVKPANVCVDSRGRATLIDLGASGSLPEGLLAGSREYLAPELLEGAKPSPRSDLHALGVTLDVIARKMSGDLRELRALAARLTAHDPEDRPLDAREVLDQLGFLHEDDERVLPARLVGREAEIARFEAALATLLARTPGPRVVWVRGVSGSGRSRLLREYKWIAGRRAAEVVEGNALERRPVGSMASRASGEPVGDDLRALLDAKDALARRGDPVVFVLDDVERLAPSERDRLDAWVRTTSERDPTMLVLASSTQRTLDDDDARMEAIDLGPLSPASIIEWLGDRVAPRDLPEGVHLRGGLPGDVVDRLGAGGRSPDARLGALDADARAAIALLIALDGAVAPGIERALALRDRDVDALGAARHARRDDGVLRLARLGDADALARALGDEVMRAAHARLATLDDLGHAERARHLAHADQPAGAAAILRGARDDIARSPDAYRRSAHALADCARGVDDLLLAAEILDEAGDSRAALDVLVRLARRRPPVAVRAEVQLRAASCRLRLGDGRAVLRALASFERLATRAFRARVAPSLRARANDLACRASIQQGRYADCATRASAMLAGEDAAGLASPLLAALHEDLGVARSYLGDAPAARDHLERAERLLSGGGSPRALVRTLSYRAIHEYRVGALGAASDAYRRALAIAEQEKLVDQVASAALNLGTVVHRRGAFAEALVRYEDALRLATALGKLRTVLAARLDLGQLHADLHQLDRAADHATQVTKLAKDQDVPFFVAAAEMLAGEIALHRGDRERANSLFSKAIDAFGALGATREQADVRLLAAELALSGPAPSIDDAVRELDSARVAIDQSSAHDLDAREGLLAARVALARGAVPAAIARLEDSARRAREAEQRDLEAEIESWLAAALDRDGAVHAARARRAHALATWDQSAAGLAPVLRERFASHPRRVAAMPATSPRAGAGLPSDPAAAASDERARTTTVRDSKLARLVRINARLSARLRADDVLEDTMDAAIDLTGAERGFLLLGKPGERPARGERMQVAVARNLDRESVRRSAMKFSRTITERVLATGEPILTSEALSDERFSGQRSVQAMQLQSVLCVPLRAGDDTLGALYVDNRFARGRFDASDLEVLVGLATQVAIALTNARLHADLDARTRELESERARIAELLAEKERELDRLAEQVRSGHAPLAERHESLGGIVGRSAGMRTLLAALERVIDSSATVLVMGESGTGKELVARALHREGPRRDAPYVTINCAALPETLLESELFGHVRGAFTGADQDRAGLFVRAGRGTLFLDEIGELPLGMQAKLLRALQEREVRPLGSSKTIPVSARIVCATNRDLESEIDAGRFRRDLYYRLAVVELVLPPLRERLDDLPELARHLLDRLAHDHGRAPPPSLTPAALRRLLGHRWPGNVRELENVLSRALLFARGETLGADDLVLPASASSASRRSGHRDYRMREAARIASALEEHRWNVTEVARVLGIPRTSLYRKLREHGLGRTRSTANRA